MAEPVANAKGASTRSYASRRRTKLLPSLLPLIGLNDHCLEHIFECLDTISLARMCKVSDRFDGIITSRIIPYRTIDFTKISKTFSVRKIFALFGKSMTRIILNVHDIQVVTPGYTKFTEFLRLLIEFGEPGKLKEVHLASACFSAHYANIFPDARPFFSNVHKLSIDYFHMDSNDMAMFDLANLREFRIHCICRVPEWLQATQFVNLQKLHVCFIQSHDWMTTGLIQAKNESILINFISGKKDTLIDFECINAPSENIFVELSRHNPNIERVHGLKYWSNTDATMDNRKWRYLDAFTHLKHIGLRSDTANFSDSGEAFRILAKHQTIVEMKLTFGFTVENRAYPVKINDLKRLTRLKTLHMNNFDDKRCKEFVNELFGNLPALAECTINGKHPTQGRIIELIGLAKHLQVLKFTGSFRTFSVDFYKKLVKLRAPPDGQETDDNHRITIYINGDDARACIDKLKKRYKPNIITIRLNEH